VESEDIADQRRRRDHKQAAGDDCVGVIRSNQNFETALAKFRDHGMSKFLAADSRLCPF
jgi:hypothetical protein